MYTHFVYTVPHIARVAFFKGFSIPNTVRGTVYTHFVYTVPHIQGRRQGSFARGCSGLNLPTKGVVIGCGHYN